MLLIPPFLPALWYFDLSWHEVVPGLLPNASPSVPLGIDQRKPSVTNNRPQRPVQSDAGAGPQTRELTPVTLQKVRPSCCGARVLEVVGGGTVPAHTNEVPLLSSWKIVKNQDLFDVIWLATFGHHAVSRPLGSVMSCHWKPGLMPHHKNWRKIWSGERLSRRSHMERNSSRCKCCIRASECKKYCGCCRWKFSLAKPRVDPPLNLHRDCRDTQAELGHLSGWVGGAWPTTGNKHPLKPKAQAQEVWGLSHPSALLELSWIGVCDGQQTWFCTHSLECSVDLVPPAYRATKMWCGGRTRCWAKTSHHAHRPARDPSLSLSCCSGVSPFALFSGCFWVNRIPVRMTRYIAHPGCNRVHNPVRPAAHWMRPVMLWVPVQVSNVTVDVCPVLPVHTNHIRACLTFPSSVVLLANVSQDGSPNASSLVHLLRSAGTVSHWIRRALCFCTAQPVMFHCPG